MLGKWGFDLLWLCRWIKHLFFLLNYSVCRQSWIKRSGEVFSLMKNCWSSTLIFPYLCISFWHHNYEQYFRISGPCQKTLYHSYHMRKLLSYKKTSIFHFLHKWLNFIKKGVRWPSCEFWKMLYLHTCTKTYPAAFESSVTITWTWKSNLEFFWLFHGYYFHYYP